MDIDQEETEASYYLDIICEPEDGGFACGDGYYPESARPLLVAFENDGFEFDGWYLDGSKISGETDLSVEKVSSDLTYTAKFKRLSYKVKVKIKGDGNRMPQMP